MDLSSDDIVQEMRRDHLLQLEPIVNDIVKICPLPLSYDVVRNQKAYFTEFTYTELVGGVLVTPQSNEISMRMSMRALQDTNSSIDENIEETIVARWSATNTLDKYKLVPATRLSKKVVFLPGSNLLRKIVSKENFFRYMFDNQDAVIKPHPLTNQLDIKFLTTNFGVNRVAKPDESGWEYLRDAAEVVTTSTSEMAIYAALLKKKIVNITNFFEESAGAFHPITYFAFGISDPEQRRDTILKVLSSPYSGFVSPHQKEFKPRLQQYFNQCMAERELMRPLTFDGVVDVHIAPSPHLGQSK